MHSAKLLVVAACFLFTLWTGSVHAQAGDEAYRADCLRLMSLTGSDAFATQMGDYITQNIIASVKQVRPDIPPRALDVVREVVGEQLRKAFDGPSGLKERTVAIWAKYFTHDEVRGLLRFYESDLGRKTAATMPTLFKEGTQMGEAWAKERLPEIGAALEARLKAEGLLQDE